MSLPTESVGRAHAEGARPLFKDIAEEWLRLNESAWRAAQRHSMSSTVRFRLNQYFGNLPFEAIRDVDVEDFIQVLATEISHRKKPLSQSRKHHIVEALSKILIFGALKIGITPVSGFTKVGRTDHSFKADPFSLKEVTTLLYAIRDDFKDYLTIRLGTGLQANEIHGLQWEHVDFDGGLVNVTEVRFAQDATTEECLRARTIHLDETCKAAFKRQFILTGKLAAGYVFCNLAGNSIDTKNLQTRVWYPLLRLAKVRRRPMYQLRHTTALMWLTSGKSEDWVASQLGVVDGNTVKRRYGPLTRSFDTSVDIDPASISVQQKPKPRYVGNSMKVPSDHSQPSESAHGLSAQNSLLSKIKKALATAVMRPPQ